MITGLSDHNLTLVARKLTNKRFHPYLTENEFIGISRGKQESFKNTAQQIEWDNVIRGIDSEEDTQIFTKTLEKTLEKIKHKRNKNQIPWMNSNIIQLMKERDKVLKNALKTKSTHDRSHFAMLRNKVVKQLGKAKADFLLTILEHCKGNPK